MPMQPPAQPPQAAPQPAPQGGSPQPEAQQGGSVVGLIEGVHGGLSSLAEVLGSSPNVPDEVKSEMQELLSRFDGLIKSLASGGGQQPSQPVPIEAGSQKVQPSL